MKRKSARKPAEQPKPAAQLMSQAAYARHRGVSKQYISKLGSAGVLVMESGKVNATASDAVLDDRDPASLSPDADPQNLTQARFLKELFVARLRRLEYQEKAAEMIPAATVSATWSNTAQAIKTRLLGIPSKISPQLAALTDARQVRDALSNEIERCLRSLSEELRYG